MIVVLPFITFIWFIIQVAEYKIFIMCPFLGLQRLGIYLVLFSILVLWQHNARIKRSNNKPSVALSWLFKQSKLFFINVGEQLARISSFLNFIKDIFEYIFTNVFDSVFEVLEPLLHIMISPWYIVYGYLKVAETYKYSVLVPLGTALLVSISYVLYVKYQFSSGE